VVGDKKGPAEFHLPNARFYALQDQLNLDFSFPGFCPTGHYARKNIGYLLAIAKGAQVIIDTDDDNYPLTEFWAERRSIQNGSICDQNGWVNVYRYFSEANIWPRGLPLDQVRQEPVDYDQLPVAEINCPIQQGLANENPDVDAVYRLLFSLPQFFRDDRRVILTGDSWCPFNSQNTTWFKEAFPLLYLPAYCSFRMTDIWRSFIAQRVCKAQGWGILFDRPTVRQDRNEHDLNIDFADEVPGYLGNHRIMQILRAVPLATDALSLPEAILACYEALVSAEFFPQKELILLKTWLGDLANCMD